LRPQELLISEGLEGAPLTKEIYIRRSINDLLHGDAVAWMYDAIRIGLTQIIQVGPQPSW
jgi:hypothetical protein